MVSLKQILKNPKGYKTPQEVMAAIYKATAFVKQQTGIANNAAWLACLDAIDGIKKQGLYKQRTKQELNAVIKAFKDYELALLHTTENPMFRIADIPEQERKRFGDITDREYYEFWCATGGVAYKETRLLITSLQHKFAVAMKNHDTPSKMAEAAAWGYTGLAALTIAADIWRESIRSVVAELGLPKEDMEQVFTRLNMINIRAAWSRAIKTIMVDEHKITEHELRNIQLGIEQLAEKWSDYDLTFDSVAQAAEAYDEVFRTKGEQKKLLREVAEIRSENPKPKPKLKR